MPNLLHYSIWTRGRIQGPVLIGGVQSTILDTKEFYQLVTRQDVPSITEPPQHSISRDVCGNLGLRYLQMRPPEKAQCVSS